MLQARWFRNHHSWWKNLVWGRQDTTLESSCLSNHSFQVDQYHILQFLSFNWPVHLQGKTAYKLRVCTCLENPWISRVQFQGLENCAWNWFSVLESPWFFYWTRLKNINAWLLSKWKPVKTKCSSKQSITFSKCSWNVWKVVFHSQCTLLVTLTCMLSYGCTVHVWFSHFVKVLFSIVSVCVVGLRWRPQCQASVILMKNGWKKTSISQNWVVKVNYCKV